MNLDTSIETLPATSGITVHRLQSLGINTYNDLLNYFPFRYDNYSLISPISKIQEGEIATIKGIIKKVENIYTKKGTRIQKVKLEDESGSIDLTWYNQPFLVRVLHVGEGLSVAGSVKTFGSSLVLQPQEYEPLKNLSQETIHTGRIVPVYSEKKGLSSKTIRTKIHYVIQNVPKIDEIYPPEIISFNKLVNQTSAYINIHFPSDFTVAKHARDRLAFDELFVIQLSAAYVRAGWQQEKVKNKFQYTDKMKSDLQILIKSLPYQLTQAQVKSLTEIIDDLKQPKPMNRFLEGEVGSGKTVVAAIACYLCKLNGFKSLFMAPTEILAQQHYRTIRELFATLPEIKTVLLTSSTKPSSKDLASANVVIGTHALIQKDLEFKKVGLVIVDEQHRFGVRQRAMLKEKAMNPHLLTMTATPIPRTVLLTLYGELDLSIIDEMPHGRIPIRTFLVPKEKRQSGYLWIRDQVKKMKSQVFVICPLIEESEVETMESLKAAKKEFLFLSSEIFPDLRVGLLHGRLKSKEKENVMNDFKDNKFDILVSTSVVEVGIDIPNATIILIEGADRFGLAQLHQLRGRVGRGKKQSYCLLFTEGEDERTTKRLQFFCHTQSGIRLAEYDLKLRGPGDIYGTKQHGYLDLKVASLSDISLINRTKRAVTYFMNTYPDISAYPQIQHRLEEVRIKQISRD